ncbi:glycosyltransferase family 2 protein [Tundrisphaera lichenicola]|uniref:glycosyltransferase family 2 protein n=1 Tax=Tundrisphaera lichenicola TaxID=2029860 RepID=UPI003EB6A615
MNRPVCSVVIPTYNGRHLLSTCLASIRRHQPAGAEIEVVVADDASSDDTREWLREAHPDVVFVQLERNAGFCGAANAGIAAARGEFIQLLNNDTEVEAGWIEAGLAPFVDPRVGSVAPLVLVRSDPGRVDSAGDSYAAFGWPSKRGHGQETRLWADRPSDRVFGASGSSAFYRSIALRAVGGFDLSFGSYYEDVDLAFRLRWAGYDCVFAPDCRILHDLSASYDHGSPSLQRRMARNSEILFWSNLPIPWLVLAAIPHAAFLMIQGLWRLARGRPGPFLWGKVDALRLWPTLAPRRRFRADLAKNPIARPRFPIDLAPIHAARDHLHRPKESRTSIG